jgi:hypothetical protein
MGFGEEFRRAYGQGTSYRQFDDAARSRLAPRIPDYLLALWDVDGWASYRNGLLWFVDPEDFDPVVQAWNLPEESPLAVVARTAFGHLYLLGKFAATDGSSVESIIALNPHIAEYSFVGPYAEQFLTRSIARDQYVRTLHEADVRRAAKDVGTLAWNEMYGYEPALALGGSDDPANVRRLNIFTHHLLLSQLGPAKLRQF